MWNKYRIGNIVRNLYLFGCMMVILTANANAYLDPSVMTYAIQVVAGVAVAGAAVAGVLWRKAKRKVQDKLGIDENAKKEVEEDIVEIHPDEQK